MGYRRKSRELAMQALFYMDMAKSHADDKLQLFCQVHPPPEKVRPFFLQLVKGVNHCRAAIDAVIGKYSDHWKIDRMSSVDRNVMRIAVFEMAFCPDIPHKVSINEAIDIGKDFGYEESGAFINGILDSIHLALRNNEIRIETKPPDDLLKTPLPPDDDEVRPGPITDAPTEENPLDSTIQVTSRVRKRLRRLNQGD